MQSAGAYKNVEIREGLKPRSKIFRYYFRMLESAGKKCNYCAWIVDDALSRFDPSNQFNPIVASHHAAWHRWVKEKINGGDFRNRALEFDNAGEQEINLLDVSEHVMPG